MKKDLFVCTVTAAVSLIVAAVCHACCPGLGAALKPLLWPLVPMAFLVRTRAALATALAVPFLSAAVNGMPAWSTAVTLAAVGLAAVSAIGCVRLFVRNRLAAVRS